MSYKQEDGGKKHCTAYGYKQDQLELFISDFYALISVLFYTGYDVFGYDKDGYDRLGYNSEGYDREGFNIQGYNRIEEYDGILEYNKEGYNVEGFNR